MGQPADPDDNQHVAPAAALDRQAQLRPLPVGTRGALLEDHRAPRLSQHVGRRSGGLLVDGHTGVGDQGQGSVAVCLDEGVEVFVIVIGFGFV